MPSPTQDNSHAPADSMAWLNELNAEQRRAVVHGDGPLLIVAGAGSGKTRTLACRVAYLMANGVPPERILLLTFTRRAAEEMLKRAAAVAPQAAAASGKAWGGTFHATANRLLRLYAKSAGLEPNFTVMDQADAEDLMNVVRHDLDLHSRDKRFPRKSTCLSIYSRCVNGEDPLPDVLKHYFPWCALWEKELRLLFKEYVGRKQSRHVLDYDDLLLYWAQLVTDEVLGDQIGARFDHILVDEYQDTNVIQSRILRGMRRRCPNLTVVGDDAQSIYSFRAATVRNMMDFPAHFPGATIVTLEQNYRSTMPILAATNRVIAQAQDRYTKDLWSDRTEGQRPKLVTCRDERIQDEYVIEQILEHYEQGIPLKKQAVLFRVGHLSDSLEIELVRRNIPFHKYGGLRFLEAAHVKDLVSILRIVENPRDEIAWFRVLQLMEGVGPTTAARVIAHVAANGNNPLALRSFSAPPAARSGFEAFASLLEDLQRGDKELPPAGQVERVRKFYDPVLAKRYDNAGVRSRDIENLEKIAASYRSRSRFLTDLQLDPPSSTSDLAGPPTKDDDWLVLSTIHSAKGCEWDVVYLIHAADGWLPSDMATGNREEIDEERRLAYVAMTRARDFLYVTWPMRYYARGRGFTDRHAYAQRSRFITAHVEETFETVTIGPGEDADAAAGVTGTRDIAAQLRKMWD